MSFHLLVDECLIALGVAFHLAHGFITIKAGEETEDLVDVHKGVFI
jgi:hypothetical protein